MIKDLFIISLLLLQFQLNLNQLLVLFLQYVFLFNFTYLPYLTYLHSAMARSFS